MPRVIIRTYSRFYDLDTDTQFESVLDPATGCFVGAAEVRDETAAQFDARPAFEVLSDDEFRALVNPAPAPEAESEQEPANSETGCPLLDAAGGQAPPEPPKG